MSKQLIQLPILIFTCLSQIKFKSQSGFVELVGQYVKHRNRGLLDVLTVPSKEYHWLIELRVVRLVAVMNSLYSVAVL